MAVLALSPGALERRLENDLIARGPADSAR